jgi:DNA-binding response OmpR family regulator
MDSENHSILVVEDEVDLADLYKFWIDAEGYVVYVANGAEEGRQLLHPKREAF